MNIRRLVDRCYEWYLRMQIRAIPAHVALIQDGNRRFARSQGMNTAGGHRAGARTTEQMLEWAQEIGITHITLYSFSTENFKRDDEELQELFDLFKDMFGKVPRDERFHRNKIRVRMFGDRSLLPDDLITCVEEAEEATAEYSSSFLNIALAYGGRNEIVHATRDILEEIRTGRIHPGDVDTSLVDQHIQTSFRLPPVDLIIRTGDEKRISNFLPWNANGNESAVYFCAPFWPVFRKIDLLRAMRIYDQRMKLGGYLPKRRLRN